MTRPNGFKITILSPVSSNFGCSASQKEGGGGWLRFRKILDESTSKSVKYYIVPVKSLKYPAAFFLPLTFISVIRTLIQTARVAKLQTVDLILCPVEDPWMIINAYLSSKLTSRKLAVFVNSIPYFGLSSMPVFNAEDFNISFKKLLHNTQLAVKSRVKAPLTAFLWYIAFRVLKLSSTRIICLNSLLVDDLSKINLKMNVVPIYPGNGIDTDAVSLVANRGLIKFDAVYASSSLVPQKGLFELIKIWRLVVDVIPDAKLAIAGKIDIAYMYVIKELNTLISNLGLSHNVTILNDPICGMTQDELWAEMKCARIFLYPSKKDVWPLVIGEALACGLPVITYNLPGIKYAYGDCTAVYLQNVSDIVGTAETVVHLLSDNLSLTELSKKSISFAKNHSWAYSVELERKAYMSVLKCK